MQVCLTLLAMTAVRSFKILFVDRLVLGLNRGLRRNRASSY